MCSGVVLESLLEILSTRHQLQRYTKIGKVKTGIIAVLIIISNVINLDWLFKYFYEHIETILWHL